MTASTLTIRDANKASVNKETFGENMNFAIRFTRLGEVIAAHECAAKAIEVNSLFGHLWFDKVNERTLDIAKSYLIEGELPKYLTVPIFCAEITFDENYSRYRITFDKVIWDTRNITKLVKQSVSITLTAETPELAVQELIAELKDRELTGKLRVIRSYNV